MQIPLLGEVTPLRALFLFLFFYSNDSNSLGTWSTFGAGMLLSNLATECKSGEEVEVYGLEKLRKDDRDDGDDGDGDGDREGNDDVDDGDEMEIEEKSVMMMKRE
eukprot:766869-Hanusia_phi.AAC.1